DLREEGHEVAEHVPLGAMIEVPAAAIALSCFIDTVDFVSIGTNDLTQYLLAADRGNDALGDLYSPLHPAVLKLLHGVIRTARAAPLARPPRDRAPAGERAGGLRRARRGRHAARGPGAAPTRRSQPRCRRRAASPRARGRGAGPERSASRAVAGHDHRIAQRR